MPRASLRALLRRYLSIRPRTCPTTALGAFTAWKRTRAQARIWCMADSPTEDETIDAYVDRLVDSWNIVIGPVAQKIIADAFRADDALKAGRLPKAA